MRSGPRKLYRREDYYIREGDIARHTAIRTTVHLGKKSPDEIEIVSGVKFAAADSLIELLIYSASRKHRVLSPPWCLSLHLSLARSNISNSYFHLFIPAYK